MVTRLVSASLVDYSTPNPFTPLVLSENPVLLAGSGNRQSFWRAPTILNRAVMIRAVRENVFAKAFEFGRLIGLYVNPTI